LNGCKKYARIPTAITTATKITSMFSRSPGHDCTGTDFSHDFVNFAESSFTFSNTYKKWIGWRPSEQRDTRA
jgi:hypothetical protein